MWTMILSFSAFIIGTIILIGISLGVFLFAYSFPYCLWLGWNAGKNDVPVKCESDNLKGFSFLTHQSSNATKLYVSWISKQPHNITKF